MTRVFVSSVISGFEDFRAAAREAVDLTGHIPVMAEDFPAQPSSPREACLDGVRSSEAFVLLLGPRYGEKTGQGVSPTEEEFEEARRLRLLPLVFKTTGSMDPEQRAFLERVRGTWESGSLYSSFTTASGLKDEVIRSLAAMGNVKQDRRAPDSKMLLDLLGSVKSEQEDVCVSVAWVPDPSGTPLVPLERIDEFASELSRQLPDVPGLSAAATHVRESSVEFERRYDRDEPFARAEIFDDLRFVCGVGLRNTTRNPGDLCAYYYVDQERLEGTLDAVLRFLAMAIESGDEHRRIRQGWLQFELHGIRNKELGALPSEPLRSYTVPMHDATNDLVLPSTPFLTQVRELAQPGQVISTLVAALARRVADVRRIRY